MPHLLSRCFAAVFGLAMLPIAHAQFSPVGGTATLTVSYRITGGGNEVPASRERHVEWKVLEEYRVQGTLTAKPAFEVAGLHKAEPGQQARMREQQAQAQAAMADAAGPMAQAERLMAKCGEDAACIQREVMAMSKTLDMDKMRSAQAHAEKAAVRGVPRYQLFEGKTFTGAYKIEESAREAYFDAACSLATEARCMIQSTVKGAGALSLHGKTTLPWVSMVEYDAQGGSVALIFGAAAQGEVTRTVLSADALRRSGTTQEIRTVPAGQDDPIIVKCGACRTAEGSYVMALEDRLLKRPAKLEVHWRLQRP